MDIQTITNNYENKDKISLQEHYEKLMSKKILYQNALHNISDFVSAFRQPTNIWLLDHKKIFGQNYHLKIKNIHDKAIRALGDVINQKNTMYHAIVNHAGRTIYLKDENYITIANDNDIKKAVSQIKKIYDLKISKLDDYRIKIEHTLACIEKCCGIIENLLAIDDDKNFVMAYFHKSRSLTVNMSPLEIDKSIFDEIIVKMNGNDIVIEC